MTRLQSTGRLLLLALMAWASPTTAQGLGVPSGTPWQGTTEVTTALRFQSITDGDTTLEQTSVPVAIRASLSESFDVQVFASYVRSTGDGLTSLSGLSDAQVATSYRVPLGAGQAVASLRLAVPGGASTLTADEAETAFLVGQEFYGLQASSFRRGASVTPGVTWAFPLTDRAVVGLGAAFSVRPSYTPLEETATAFDPADEVLLTAGVSSRLANGTELSADATYVRYGSDAWGDILYQTGDAVGLAVRWSGLSGPLGFDLVGGFLRRGETDVADEAGTPLSRDAAIPTRGYARGTLRGRLGRSIVLDGFAGGRYYAESEVFTAKALVDLGLAPQVTVAEGLTLLGHVGLTLGDIQSTDVGLGLRWSP